MDASTPAVILKLHRGGLGAARTLGRLGVPVYAIHNDPRAPAARSRYLREHLEWDVDRAPAEETVRFLIGLSERLGTRPILIPPDDAEAILVDDHADRLRDAYLFPAQPPGLGRRLYNKRDMHLACREIGIPTPDATFPGDVEEVLDYAASGTFPVVLKTIAMGIEDEASVAIASDPQELVELYGRMQRGDEPNVMLQEYIPGGEDSVWMFNGYFDEHSEAIFGLVGRKLRQSPPYRGMTSLGIVVRNDDLARLTCRFMKAVGYRGILDIGWRFDARDGQYKALDVNPRLGATFRLFVEPGGLDVVRCMYLHLTGQPIPPAREAAGRKWLALDRDLASSFQYWRDGRLTLRAWLRSLAGVQELAWYASDDRRPFFARWREILGKAARRVAGLDRPS
jgi:D-aspartate ligase